MNTESKEKYSSNCFARAVAAEEGETRVAPPRTPALPLQPPFPLSCLPCSLPCLQVYKKGRKRYDTFWFFPPPLLGVIFSNMIV